jgi:uncharacterized lipoprotein YddW (UPF0748 family)
VKPIALAATLSLCLAAPGAAPAGGKAKPEVRAVWVVRTSITSEAAVGKLVADAKAAGINTLIVQVRGRGDAFYKSRLEPRSAYLKGAPDSFDPLASVLAKAHAARIKVHAWLNTHLLCDLADLPSDPEHVYRKHPDWLAVPRRAAAELAAMDPESPRYRKRIVQVSKEDTTELEGIYTDPANPAVKDHIAAVFSDVAENYDVDGIHFDFIRYPNSNFSYSRTALDRFRAAVEPGLREEERKREAGLAKTRPLVYVEFHPEDWDRFRRQQITELVERVSAAVRASKPRVMITAAVFANDDDAYRHRFQDWKTWLERGLLDAVCPMAYTPDTLIWKRQIAAARESSFGRQVWAGIGAYRQPPSSALEKVRAGRRMGVDGLVFFSYGQMTSPSEWAPAGDYLQRIGRGAFR